MASKKITITLPEELVEAAREFTDNVSGFAAEALADKIRGELLDQEIRRHEAEHGVFTQEEMAAARRALYGDPTTETGAA